MNQNQNDPNQNQNPSSGGPQFGTENQDKGGWGKKMRGWLNKYGSSVILPIIALLILAGGIYLYASQKEQVAGLPDEAPSATSSEDQMETPTEDQSETDSQDQNEQEQTEDNNQEKSDNQDQEDQEEQNQQEQEQEQQEQEQEQEQEQQSTGEITETAQAGEGVTHLARKAAQSYLKNNSPEENLTKEHKVYIEDYLQNQKGSDSLSVGQKVTFSEKEIQEAINASLQLNQNQLKNLEKYSQHISW